MGFEPTRAEHIGLAVQRLNHSATSSTGNIGVTGVVLLFFYGGHFQFPDFLLIQLPISYFKLGKKKKYTETALIKEKYMIFLVKTFSFDNVDEERQKKDFENMRELNVLLLKAFSCVVQTSILLVPITCTFYWFGERCFVWVLYITIFSALNANVALVSQRDLIVGIAKGNYHDIVT